MIQDFTTRIVKRDEIAKDIWHLSFELLKPSEINFAAGQYMILQVGDQGMRNYSIVSTPESRQSFDLLVEHIPGGLGSEYLKGLSLSDEVRFKGPAGIFVLKKTPETKIFLATGTGIAPIYSMLRDSLGKASTPMHLFWGLRGRQEVYFLEEFMELQKQYPHFKFRICLSREEDFGGLDPSCFGRGRVTTHVAGLIDVLKNGSNTSGVSEYYLCGGKSVVDSLRQMLIDLHADPTQITFEKFV